MASLSNTTANSNGNDDGETEDLARCLNNESRVSSNEKTLVFIIRVRDGWTKHLARHAENLITSQSQGEKVGMGSGKPNLRLRFLIDGPYSGKHLKDAYDSLILVAGEWDLYILDSIRRRLSWDGSDHNLALSSLLFGFLSTGGSGVSWTLPYLCDMVRRSSQKEDFRVKKLTWIWVIREEGECAVYSQRELRRRLQQVQIWFISYCLSFFLHVRRPSSPTFSDHLAWISPELSQVLNLLSKSSLNVSLQFYITAKVPDPSSSLQKSSQLIRSLHSSPSVIIKNGRPDFDSIFQDSLEIDEKTLVACSGPSGMSSNLREKVRGLLRPGKVDKVEFKCEEFGW